MVSPSLHRKETKSALVKFRVRPSTKALILKYGGPNITEYIESLVRNDIRRKKRRAANGN